MPLSLYPSPDVFSSHTVRDKMSHSPHSVQIHSSNEYSQLMPLQYYPHRQRHMPQTVRLSNISAFI